MSARAESAKRRAEWWTPGAICTTSSAQCVEAATPPSGIGPGTKGNLNDSSHATVVNKRLIRLEGHLAEQGPHTLQWIGR